MRARSAHREAILDFVLLAAAQEGTRPFPEPVVEALRRVVPSDTVAYREWSRERGIVDRSFAPDELADRWEVWQQYPSFRDDDPYPSELGGRSGRPAVSARELMATPLVLKDAVGGRRFWHTGLYYELMRPFGIRDVMKVFLPPSRGTASVFVFDTSGSGFCEHDRLAVARVVRALIQLQRNAQLRSSAGGAAGALRRLTSRELTVLARVADGETNAEIASALFIGESTVRKHLEHIYDKLDVRNRTAAAAAYTQASQHGTFT